MRPLEPCPVLQIVHGLSSKWLPVHACITLSYLATYLPTYRQEPVFGLYWLASKSVSARDVLLQWFQT
jgi:hypothetical protein